MTEFYIRTAIRIWWKSLFSELIKVRILTPSFSHSSRLATAPFPFRFSIHVRPSAILIMKIFIRDYVQIHVYQAAQVTLKSAGTTYYWLGILLLLANIIAFLLQKTDRFTPQIIQRLLVSDQLVWISCYLARVPVLAGCLGGIIRHCTMNCGHSTLGCRARQQIDDRSNYSNNKLRNLVVTLSMNIFVVVSINTIQFMPLSNLFI